MGSMRNNNNKTSSLKGTTVMEFNPELFETKATHRFNGELVRVFGSTIRTDDSGVETATGEILTGDGAGKWTTVYIAKAKKV